MTKQEFKKDWQRLINCLETRLSPQKLKTRFEVAFDFFSVYPSTRWQKTVDACLHDPGRRWFPTPGELVGYFNDTAPPTETMDEKTRAILADPELDERLGRETQEWFEKEVLPSLEGTPMLRAEEGSSDDETEGQKGPIGGSGASGSKSPTDKH